MDVWFVWVPLAGAGCLCCFFFQAEDGIGDLTVTGVQTCALPISTDGTAGLRLARRSNYDLIVLDLVLPGIDGYRFCKLLRRAGDWTPVLVLTAKQGELRSEERRVGKEGRSRWSPYH